jgi:hypothetical protein
MSLSMVLIGSPGAGGRTIAGPPAFWSSTAVTTEASGRATVPLDRIECDRETVHQLDRMATMSRG